MNLGSFQQRQSGTGQLSEGEGDIATPSFGAECWKVEGGDVALISLHRFLHVFSSSRERCP